MQKYRTRQINRSNFLGSVEREERQSNLSTSTTSNTLPVLEPLFKEETQPVLQQIGQVPNPNPQTAEEFTPYATIYGQEDHVDYLPQTVVDVADLISYPESDKIIVKDFIYDVPQGQAIELSFNKDHQELATFYTSSIPGTSPYSESVQQKAVLFEQRELADLSSGLFTDVTGYTTDPSNIVGTAYSGKQWMAARQAIVNNSTKHSGIFRYFGNQWSHVPVTNTATPPAEGDAYRAGLFNTDIKYLKHQWYALRGYGMTATGNNLSVSNVTNTTPVSTVTTAIGLGVSNNVQAALRGMQVLHSVKKDADELQYHTFSSLTGFANSDNFYQTLIPVQAGTHVFTLNTVRAVPLDIAHIKVDGCKTEKLAITGMVSLDFTVAVNSTTFSNCTYERAFVILADFNLTNAKLYWPTFAPPEYQLTSGFLNDSAGASMKSAIQNGIQGLVEGEFNTGGTNPTTYGRNLIATRARVVVGSGVNNVLLLEATFVQRPQGDNKFITFPYRHLVLTSPIVFGEFDGTTTDFAIADTQALLHHSIVLDDTYGNLAASDDTDAYRFNPLRGPLAVQITYDYGTYDPVNLLSDLDLAKSFSESPYKYYVPLGHQSLQPILDTYHKATGVYSGNDYTWILRTLSGATASQSNGRYSFTFNQRPRFFSAIAVDLNRSDYRGLYVDPAYTPTAIAGLNRAIAISTFEYDKSVVYNTGTSIRTSGVDPSLSGIVSSFADITNRYSYSVSSSTVTQGVMSGGRLFVSNDKQGISKASVSYVTRTYTPSEGSPITVQIPHTTVSSDVRNVYEIVLDKFDVPGQTNGSSTPYYSVLSTVRANIEGSEFRQCEQNIAVIPGDGKIVTHFGEGNAVDASKYKINSTGIGIDLGNSHACAFCINKSDNSYETRYIVGRTRDTTASSDTSPIVYSDIVSSSSSVPDWDGKTWNGKIKWYFGTTQLTKTSEIPVSVFDILAYTHKNTSNPPVEKCFYIAVGSAIQHGQTLGCDNYYSMWVSDGTLDNGGYMHWYVIQAVTCEKTVRRVKRINDLIAVSGDDQSFAIWKAPTLAPGASLQITDITNGNNWCALDFSGIDETGGKSIYDFAGVSCGQLLDRLDYTGAPSNPCEGTSKYAGLPVFTLLYGSVGTDNRIIRTGAGSDTIVVSGYFRYSAVAPIGWSFVPLDYIGQPTSGNYSAGRHLYCATTFEGQVFVGGTYSTTGTHNALQVVAPVRDTTGKLLTYRPENCETTIIPPPLSNITLCTSNAGIFGGEYVRRIDTFDGYVFILVVDPTSGANKSTILYSSSPFSAWSLVDTYNNFVGQDMCIQLGGCCSPNDRIPTICRLTNTRITLPAFLCPDHMIHWLIRYRAIPRPPPEEGGDEPPCSVCQFAGKFCDNTTRSEVQESNVGRLTSKLFRSTVKPKGRTYVKSSIKGFMLDKHKSASLLKSTPIVEKKVGCSGCGSKGTVSL